MNAGVGVGTELWRSAGMNFNRYMNIAAHTLRTCIKEPLRTKILARSEFTARIGKIANGKLQERRDVKASDVL